MPTAFVDVTVVPMRSDASTPHQTVLIDDGRITWIGQADDAQLPPGTRRIDGRGHFLMPGLADMHCHPTTEADLRLCLAYGVTTVRNMWGMPRHLKWREQVINDELLGPDIHTTGPIVERKLGRNRWTLSASTPREAAQAVRATKAAGYAAVKVYDELTPDVYRAVMQAADDEQIPVVGHVPYLVGLDGALDAGQRSVEHLYGYLDALRPGGRLIDPPQDLADMRTMLFAAASAASPDRLSEVAEATREAGTWNCPTLLIRRRWQQEAAALARRPEMRYQSPTLAERRRLFLANYPRDPMVDRVNELNLALVKALHDAGAGLLTGTDAGVPTIVFGASLHEELEAFVGAGLSPYRALRAATVDAADFVGETDEWGTVAVGSRADVLLVEDDPLVDVANALRLVGVMKRGRWLSATELQADLDALADEQAAGLLPASKASGNDGPAQRSVRRVGYEVEWSGHLVGVEELQIEPTQGQGTRLTWRSTIDMFDWGLSAGAEAGSYRSETELDAAGLDQTARLTYDGPDGHHAVELTREKSTGRIRINETDPIHGHREQRVEVPEGVLLCNYLSACYVRLGIRLRTLAPGRSAELELLGPGLPPDFVIATSTIRAERLPSSSTDEPGVVRYSFEIVRHNASFSGCLTCDADGLMLALQFDAEPPLTVRRSKDPANQSSSAARRVTTS